MITYGSTFTGILGLDRAFEYVTGGRCAWACESSAYCREIIWQQRPGLTISGDIRRVGSGLGYDGVDAVIGGFPCQDVSDSGKRVGLEHGERTGLWRELARAIGEIRPGIVFVENVRGLLRRGFEHVLTDLARLGFDAEWTCLRASDVGAPHRRERVFVLATTADGRERLADAYRERLRQLSEWNLCGQAERRDAEPVDAGADDMGDTDLLGLPWGDGGAARPSERSDALRASGVADRMHDRRDEQRPCDDDSRRDAPGDIAHRRDALELLDHRWPPGPADAEGWARWPGARPSFRRSPDGVPGWVDRSRLAEGLRRARLRALGNAVVAQQAAAALDHLITRALE